MLFLDIESYSEADVTRIGAHAYWAHPSTEVLMVSYAVDREDIRCWDVYQDWHRKPDDLVEAWRTHRKVAFNCTFERLGMARIGFASTIHDWEDTSVLALTCGLPGDLDTASQLLELQELGKAKGRRLINTFSKPAPANHRADRYTPFNKPDEWAEFMAYCDADVEAQRQLWYRLPHHVYDIERENWLLDTEINNRGLPVDIPFARCALAAVEEAKLAANARLAELTGGQVLTVTALPKLRVWLEQQGVRVVSLDAPGVEYLLKLDLPAAAREALELRQAAGKSNVGKFIRAIESHVKGRLYGALRFYGANRTGRQAGQLVQTQNMARPTIKSRDELAIARDIIMQGTLCQLYPDPLQTATSMVRAIIAAVKGKKLVIADLSNIEGRMTAYIAKEEWKLQAFRDFDAGIGPDLYKLAFSRTFSIPVEEVTKDQRQVGKVEELAFGFGGAEGAFMQMSEAYGVNLPSDEVSVLVAGWRDAHPETVKMWRAFNSCALRAIRYPGETYEARGVSFRVIVRSGYRWLVVVLMNGRALFYFNPSISESTRWPTVEYVGQRVGKNWGPLYTHGGKFTENIVQAQSRDVLMPGIREATRRGYDVVMSAHDEIVAECPDTGDYTVAELCDCMVQPLDWCPGLPLAAAGYEDYFYRKD